MVEDGEELAEGEAEPEEATDTLGSRLLLEVAQRVPLSEALEVPDTEGESLSKGETEAEVVEDGEELAMGEAEPEEATDTLGNRLLLEVEQSVPLSEALEVPDTEGELLSKGETEAEVVEDGGELAEGEAEAEGATDTLGIRLLLDVTQCVPLTEALAVPDTEGVSLGKGETEAEELKVTSPDAETDTEGEAEGTPENDASVLPLTLGVLLVLCDALLLGESEARAVLVSNTLALCTVVPDAVEQVVTEVVEDGEEDTEGDGDPLGDPVTLPTGEALAEEQKVPLTDGLSVLELEEESRADDDDEEHPLRDAAADADESEDGDTDGEVVGEVAGEPDGLRVADGELLALVLALGHIVSVFMLLVGTALTEYVPLAVEEKLTEPLTEALDEPDKLTQALTEGLEVVDPSALTL